MQVVELLVLVGSRRCFGRQARDSLLRQTLFVADGPMGSDGPPAKLRARALEYFQRMMASTPGNGPYLSGIEKTGILCRLRGHAARHGILSPGDLLWSIQMC